MYILVRGFIPTDTRATIRIEILLSGLSNKHAYNMHIQTVTKPSFNNFDTYKLLPPFIRIVQHYDNLNIITLALSHRNIKIIDISRVVI